MPDISGHNKIREDFVCKNAEHFLHKKSTGFFCESQISGTMTSSLAP